MCTDESRVVRGVTKQTLVAMSLLLSGIAVVVKDDGDNAIHTNELDKAAEDLVNKPIIVDGRMDFKVGRVVGARVDGNAITIEAYIQGGDFVGQAIRAAVLSGELAYFETYASVKTVGPMRHINIGAVSLVRYVPTRPDSRLTYVAMPTPETKSAGVPKPETKSVESMAAATAAWIETTSRGDVGSV